MTNGPIAMKALHCERRGDHAPRGIMRIRKRFIVPAR